MIKSIRKISQTVGATLATLTLATPVQALNLLGEGKDIERPTGFAADLGQVINSVLSFVMVIAALLVLMYLIWGGIEWITSGGDKGKTESARNKITAAVIGLIVLAAAFAIFMLVIRFLGFTGTQDIFNITPIGG